MSESETYTVWTTFTRWLEENTIIPLWMPKQVRHPLTTLAFASLIQIVAIALTVGIVHLVPGFTFRGALILLGVIAVALTVGGTPGLLASLLGTLLLDFFLVSPTYTLSLKKGADMLNIFFYLLVCLATNIAASHAQHRHNAAARALENANT